MGVEQANEKAAKVPGVDSQRCDKRKDRTDRAIGNAWLWSCILHPDHAALCEGLRVPIDPSDSVDLHLLLRPRECRNRRS